MISGLIPHRYAKALYKYAQEAGAVQGLYGTMKQVAAGFSATAELQKTMSNPYVSKAAKSRLLLTLGGEKAGDAYRRFVELVLDHDREEYFYMMALAYRDIYRKENHISQVRIVSASALEAGELKRIRGLVERSFPKTVFEYEESVDPGLIGGFVIDVDSTRLDASISGELEQLRQNLITGN